MYQILNSNGIKIKRSQVDCGSFTKAVIKVVEENRELVYIRAQSCAELTANTLDLEDNCKHVFKTRIKYILS